MKVLMTAVTFPRPNNRLTGTWALKQAEALRDAGHTVRVVVPHSWVPRFAARTAGAKKYADCPASFDFGEIEAFYPRLPYYYTGPMRQWTVDRPALWLKLAWPWLKRALLHHADEFKPDVIWAHHSAVNGLAAHWLQKHCRVPFVTIDHDLDDMTETLTNPARRVPLAAEWRAAACCVGITNRMSAVIQEVQPAARAETVHNGFDVTVEPVERPAGEGLVVFSLGAFFARKNMPTLVRAFAEASLQHPSARLRIAGGGADFEIVKTLVAELNMSERIVLLGPLPHTEAMREMARADIFALVGWDEPFATVYVEAMAHGLPIVCGNDGGITDVLQNDVHGISVTPRSVNEVAAALDALLADPPRRARLGAAARVLYVSTLTGARWAERMTGIFQQASCPTLP